MLKNCFESFKVPGGRSFDLSVNIHSLFSAKQASTISLQFNNMQLVRMQLLLLKHKLRHSMEL